MGDEAFDKIALDTFEPSAGTPDVAAEGFTGIRISMPTRVSAGRLAKLPLCGVWAFRGETLAKYPVVEDSLVFLARNLDTHETATGNFRVHEDPATPAEMKAGASTSGPSADDDLPTIEPAAVTARGYFNFNLGRPWKVPAKPGRWRVTVVLHDVQSNTVEFEVVK